MSEAHIDTRLVRISLESTEGFEFERFAKQFFAVLVGADFVPLGGVHDDGADGMNASVYSDRRGQYWQFSVGAAVKPKIRATIKRLCESGLNPTVLFYATSQRIDHAAVLQDEIYRDLGVSLQLRDREYIETQVNHSPESRAAWRDHLGHRVDYLSTFGSSKSIRTTSTHVGSPDVYVFLRQEVDRRTNDGSLVDSVCDSLVLWALEGTDPDEGHLMSEEEVIRKVVREIPSVETTFAGRLPKRLEALATKVDGRRTINWHRKQGGYCLPFETRERLLDESVEDEKVRIAAQEEITSRVAAELSPEATDGEIEAAMEAALAAIHSAFAERGLSFARWVQSDVAADDPEHFASLSERIEESLRGAGLDADRFDPVFDAAKRAVGGAFYSSSLAERTYFGRLARTYVLLFSLQQEPRIVKYFQEMASSFRLYVGADQIIRSMSERYLPVEDQTTRLMLKIAQEAGATLLLTEPVANEVASHLRASDLEHRNWVKPFEEAGNVQQVLATNVPKILIRAYLYARLEDVSGRPDSWEEFLGQFCDVEATRQGTGLVSVISYLRSQIGMDFVSEADLRRMTNVDHVAELSKSLSASKSNDLLAENDALMALAVYADRRRHHEHPGNSPFGYNTWWLTDETRILSHTGALVAGNAGARYMMRPDFLLNFLALAPSAADVRSTFESVFPTMLGIRLSNRMPESTFHAVLKPLEEWNSWEPGRRVAAIEDLANQLMSDMNKQYQTRTPIVT